jgi:hypothetical protein
MNIKKEINDRMVALTWRNCIYIVVLGWFILVLIAYFCTGCAGSTKEISHEEAIKSVVKSCFTEAPESTHYQQLMYTNFKLPDCVDKQCVEDMFIYAKCNDLLKDDQRLAGVDVPRPCSGFHSENVVGVCYE